VEQLFVGRIELLEQRIEQPTAYPFEIAAVKALKNGLKLAPVTYLIGENGTGKSTILEAIAVATGFNAEGGSQNFRFSTRSSESVLHKALRLGRGAARPRTGFFLRAETFYNVASEVERLGVGDSYGERSLHEQSHGESFLALVQHRFGPKGLYILDEPEAALSPARQLVLLVRLNELVKQGSQLIIATHAPIVLALPGACIYLLDKDGITKAAYDETDMVNVTRDFLNDRPRYIRRLLDE
jgi:predicted ATPase